MRDALPKATRHCVVSIDVDIKCGPFEGPTVFNERLCGGVVDMYYGVLPFKVLPVSL